MRNNNETCPECENSGFTQTSLSCGDHIEEIKINCLCKRNQQLFEKPKMTKKIRKKNPVDNKLHLGFDPNDKKIYLGKQRDGKWVGVKRDVNNEYMGVLFHKFPPNSVQTIFIDAVESLKVIVVDMDKTVTIDGEGV